MESNKLEKPRKNGTFSTLRGVMNPHEEDRGVFPTKQPVHRQTLPVFQGESLRNIKTVS